MAKEKKNIFRKLFQKHTLIILNEESHEEQFAFRLNRMNVLVVVALMTFFTIGCTTLTLLYTPLGKYFVSSQRQLDVSDRQEILNLMNQLEEMESRVKANDIYINNIKAILSDEVPIPEFSIENEQFISSIDLSKVDLTPSKEDLQLREDVEKEELFSVHTNQLGQEGGNLLFTPLKGMITGSYNLQENHLAIDIAAQQGEAIKSVAAGTVVFANWTPDTGYVIIIQHSIGMLSVYKHALTLYKKEGEVIKKGEVIAAVGNTGELTTGPHLHFELWIDGSPVDPQQYIVF